MKIAQQLKIKDFPFEIKANGNLIYREDSDGSWIKYEYDANGKLTYYENSDGYSCKYEYDASGKLIYSEDSKGTIIDNRPKIVELTMQEIADKLGIPLNLLKIKP